MPAFFFTFIIFRIHFTGKLALGSAGAHDASYYGAISLGHGAVSPALTYHGALAHATGGLAHLGAPLADYSHGSGIGPFGAGFNRYAPSVSALSAHAPLSPSAYLKSAPVAQHALLKVLPEKHLEHFVGPS